MAEAAADGERCEAALPEWQRKLNTFCENWLYAFLIAMAIRHFALEPFRIPSASMEPMLYGDPSFFKGDLVVVDKLWWRATGLRRWDVAVFQFPLPELPDPKADAVPALDELSGRLDHPLFRPLLNRSFVKRIVGMPGDRFYIAGGNYYAQQPDGSFRIVRRPEAVQERLWDPIYRHGAQPGYLPWAGRGGAEARADGPGLAIAVPPQGQVVFTQPLINLYLKPGVFGVAPTDQAAATRHITLSQVAPAFDWQGQAGDAWHLDRWKIDRLNSADLDNQAHGRNLNALGNEPVCDLRWTMRIAQVEGRMVFRSAFGVAQSTELELRPDGWCLRLDGAERAAAAGPVSGRTFQLARLDDEIICTCDGKTVFRGEVAPVQPAEHPLQVSWSGTGSVVLAESGCERDVHYCVRGFLQPGEPAGTLQDRQVRALLAGRSYDSLAGAERRTAQAVSPQTAVTIPPGCYLMLGDNSMVSWDGRNWGYVPGENFRGRAWVVGFPVDRTRVIR